VGSQPQIGTKLSVFPTLILPFNHYTARIIRSDGNRWLHNMGWFEAEIHRTPLIHSINDCNRHIAWETQLTSALLNIHSISWRQMFSQHLVHLSQNCSNTPQCNSHGLRVVHENIAVYLLQRGHIACNAQRSISHDNSVCKHTHVPYPDEWR